MPVTLNTEHRSPNFDDRGESVDMIVLHYTGMKTGSEALERLCDPTAKVSAHYLVEEDGTVFALVDEEQRAWHAGVSHWQGRDNVNGCSIGIEIVNPGHDWGYRPFPEAQIASVIALMHDIRARHHVPPARIVGHSDVAPARKADPGELFPWDRLAGEGIAIGPYDATQPPPLALPSDANCADMLRDIGYGLEAEYNAAVITAFQRRFIPAELDKGLSEATRAAIADTHGNFVK